MGFTTESMAPTQIGTITNQPNQFNLESKEFVGYDPKGTTSITGSPLVKTEAPTEPAEAPVPQVPEEESITLSPKISAIARKEQAQRQREKDLANKERTFAEKMADAEKYRKLTEKLANKDYSAVDELNIPYEEIVKHELTKEAAKDPVKEEIQKLREENEAIRKSIVEKEHQEYQANQALWKKEVDKTIQETDEFPTLKIYGGEKAVLDHINDSFEEDGIELTVDEAAAQLEEAAYQDKLADYEKFLKVQEFKSISKVSENKVLGAPKTAIKTITQNMTTTPKTSPASKPFHLMNEHEQIQEAIRRVQAAKLQR